MGNNFSLVDAYQLLIGVLILICIFENWLFLFAQIECLDCPFQKALNSFRNIVLFIKLLDIFTSNFNLIDYSGLNHMANLYRVIIYLFYCEIAEFFCGLFYIFAVLCYFYFVKVVNADEKEEDYSQCEAKTFKFL